VKTTVDLDPEVLEIARNIALERKVAIGRVISDVFLKNVRQESSRNRNGVRVIERGESAEPVTLEIVNRLRDER
jgi:hypothetical protein